MPHCRWKTGLFTLVLIGNQSNTDVLFGKVRKKFNFKIDWILTVFAQLFFLHKNVSRIQSFLEIRSWLPATPISDWVHRPFQWEAKLLLIRCFRKKTFQQLQVVYISVCSARLCSLAYESKKTLLFLRFSEGGREKTEGSPSSTKRKSRPQPDR